MLRRRLSSLLATSIASTRTPVVVRSSSFRSSPAFQQNAASRPLPPKKYKSLKPQGVSLLALNDLRNNPGATKKKKRLGRGIGSGKGKTCGRGHKGQKARGGHKFGFEGGQTPLRLRVPKRGFHNPFSLTFKPVNLGRVAKLINAGKIDSSELITMKTLKDAGGIGKKIEDGVKLMARGAQLIKWPIHLEVSRVSASAKAAVEAAGGSVRKVHYNTLGLRALLKPEWFVKKRRLLPRPARPPPKQAHKVDSIGRLPAPNKPIPFPAEEKVASADA